MKRLTIAILAAGFVAAVGCSVVPKKFEAHITIDIRQHIEQQATSTLDFIEGKTDSLKQQEEKPAAPDKTSWIMEIRDALSPISPAYAEELKAASPEVERIAAALRARNSALQDLKNKGIAGESNRGYVEIRPSELLKDPSAKNAGQRLAAAENKDRKALYEEIAKLNKEQHVSVSTVERIYAGERLKRAKLGEIFQLPAEGPEFDAFKASPQGKKLAADCVASAWVTIK